MRIQNAVPEGISAFMGQTTAALIIGFMQKMSTGRLFYVAGTSLLPATIATTVCHHRGIALDVLPTSCGKAWAKIKKDGGELPTLLQPQCKRLAAEGTASLFCLQCC